MRTAATPSPSTPKPTLFGKSSDGLLTFADFIGRLRVTTTPRGDLIATYKTLISARAFPAFTCWAELYRFMSRRAASPDTVNEARRLWNEYRKSQPVVSPTKHRRAGYG